ncbi:unnamed protein product [Trichobilharzia szidati]|nr:unnamed protein product [Trichobilharzia szidati]
MNRYHVDEVRYTKRQYSQQAGQHLIENPSHHSTTFMNIFHEFLWIKMHLFTNSNFINHFVYFLWLWSIGVRVNEYVGLKQQHMKTSGMIDVLVMSGISIGVVLLVTVTNHDYSSRRYRLIENESIYWISLSIDRISNTALITDFKRFLISSTLLRWLITVTHYCVIQRKCLTQDYATLICINEVLMYTPSVIDTFCFIVFTYWIEDYSNAAGFMPSQPIRSNIISRVSSASDRSDGGIRVRSAGDSNGDR